MKKSSKSLETWSDILNLAGFVLIVLSIIGFVMDSSGCGAVFICGFLMFPTSSVLYALSVMTKNAERELNNTDEE